MYRVSALTVSAAPERIDVDVRALAFRPGQRPPDLHLPCDDDSPT
jgi:hypothetical protein